MTRAALTDTEKKDIASGEHFCLKCKKITNWEIIGGRMQRCDNCKDRFPCASQTCGHADCTQARKKK